jgi:hypothetical protein
MLCLVGAGGVVYDVTAHMTNIIINNNNFDVNDNEFQRIMVYSKWIEWYDVVPCSLLRAK